MKTYLTLHKSTERGAVFNILDMRDRFLSRLFIIHPFGIVEDTLFEIGIAMPDGVYNHVYRNFGQDPTIAMMTFRKAVDLLAHLWGYVVDWQKSDLSGTASTEEGSDE